MLRMAATNSRGRSQVARRAPRARDEQRHGGERREAREREGAECNTERHDGERRRGERYVESDGALASQAHHEVALAHQPVLVEIREWRSPRRAT